MRDLAKEPGGNPARWSRCGGPAVRGGRGPALRPRLMHGTMHLSIGQEAVAVGACLALRRRRRDHLDPPRPRPLHRQGRRPDADDGRAVAKDTGYCRGRGGSMHIADLDHRQPRRQRHRRRRDPDRRRPRWRIKLRGSRHVVVSFFGDGAANEGAFHEASEPGRDLGAAGRVRLREQPVRRFPSPPRRSAVADSPTGPRLRLRPRDGRRQRRLQRSTTRCRRPSSARAAGGGPTLVEPSPTAGTATPRATRTSTAPARRSPTGRARPDRARRLGAAARCERPRGSVDDRQRSATRAPTAGLDRGRLDAVRQGPARAGGPHDTTSTWSTRTTDVRGRRGAVRDR